MEWVMGTLTLNLTFNFENLIITDLTYNFIF